MNKIKSATTVDQLEKYVKEAKANLKKGAVPTISNKTQLTTEDRLKISLCKIFVRFIVDEGLKLNELSDMTGIEYTRLSEVVNYKVTKFKIGKLIEYLDALSKHNSEVKQHIKFLEEVFETPIQKVTQSKKIVNSIRKLSTHYAH